MKRYAALAALMTVLATPAMAQQAVAVAPAAPAALDPQTYRVMAMISDSFEIQAARLAQQRSTNPRVRAYADAMIRDHSMTSQALMGGVQVAALGMMAPTLDARHAAMLNQLASASGAQFDRLYGQMMVQSHQEALALHASYSQASTDPALRNFAASVTPHIRHHLGMARGLPGGRG
jgi:predicted outer membrane protein